MRRHTPYVNRSGGLGELRRTLYVLNMNVHKPRTRPQTKIRMEKDVVEACRRVVAEYEREEHYRYMMMTTPLRPTPNPWKSLLDRHD